MNEKPVDCPLDECSKRETCQIKAWFENCKIYRMSKQDKKEIEPEEFDGIS